MWITTSPILTMHTVVRIHCVLFQRSCNFCPHRTCLGCWYDLAGHQGICVDLVSGIYSYILMAKWNSKTCSPQLKFWHIFWKILYVYLNIYIYMYIRIYLFIYVFIYLSIYLFDIYLLILYLFIYLFIHLFTYLFIYLFSIYLFIDFFWLTYLLIHLSIYHLVLLHCLHHISDNKYGCNHNNDATGNIKMTTMVKWWQSEYTRFFKQKQQSWKDVAMASQPTPPNVPPPPEIRPYLTRFKVLVSLNGAGY